MGGRSSSSGGNLNRRTAGIRLENLRSDIEYPERVQYWVEQIRQGNNRPVLVDENNLSRVIDGNHTLAAYRELGRTPEVYSMNRIEFLNGAASSEDTVEFIRRAIRNGRARRVSIGK